MMGRRLGVCGLQCVRLELQNLRLVDLVDHGAVDPRQAPRPRVETGRQDHGLSDPRPARGDEEIVEPLGP